MASIFTEKEILKKFFEVHGSKYDYPLFKYKGMGYKATIICPIHGKFNQTPGNHVQGRRRTTKYFRRFNKYKFKTKISRMRKK